ncbi:unnamed protein product [Miscanthus lutarioriparius]|uniref:Uncharacterized protein n=1 Tax=Miscanthus lutarioriparius TaxID=422564 RepID=A0A811NYT7_9POAL|nr:unnamed protein product [Miscanthus lutarioriparius]
MERRLKWSEVPILFNLRDHPLNLYDGPLLPLVIKPYIRNYKVTLQDGENLRSEILTFEVADYESAYNCILGRPFLKKFMATAHFAYSVLKESGPHGPLTIYGDRKGAVTYDMKTLGLIKQFRRVLTDLAEPPSKQQKTTDLTVMTTPAVTLPAPIVAALVVAKPSILEAESSKAAEARSKAPILPQN